MISSFSLASTIAYGAISGYDIDVSSFGTDFGNIPDQVRLYLLSENRQTAQACEIISETAWKLETSTSGSAAEIDAILNI